MNGRRSGTVGGERAAARLAQWLADAGLRPGGDGATFLQSFVLAAGRKLGAASELEIDGRRLTLGTDWTPHGGSSTAQTRGEVLFIGHGVTAPGWDDWAADEQHFAARLRRRSEEHTSELQSQSNLVCRLLLEKKKSCPTPTPAPPP